MVAGEAGAMIFLSQMTRVAQIYGWHRDMISPTKAIYRMSFSFPR